MATVAARKPTFFDTYLGKLYTAQRGLCFHCDRPMDQVSWRLEDRPSGWTREHVYPQSSTGQGLLHNIVLAHHDCNGAKGARQPTAMEVLRTKALYETVGLEAFIPAAHKKAAAAYREHQLVNAVAPVAADAEPIPPPLNNEARQAFAKIERYVEIAGDRIDRGVPYCLKTLAGLVSVFTDARARQLSPSR